MHSAVCRSKIGYGCQTIQHGIPRKTKKTHQYTKRRYKNVYRRNYNVTIIIAAYRSIRSITGAKFLYRLRINTIYTESLITLDDRKNQSYEENETKTTGVHLRKLEWGCIKEQSKVK